VGPLVTHVISIGVPAQSWALPRWFRGRQSPHTASPARSAWRPSSSRRCAIRSPGRGFA